MIAFWNLSVIELNRFSPLKPKTLPSLPLLDLRSPVIYFSCNFCYIIFHFQFIQLLYFSLLNIFKGFSPDLINKNQIFVSLMGFLVLNISQYALLCKTTLDTIINTHNHNAFMLYKLVIGFLRLLIFPLVASIVTCFPTSAASHASICCTHA